MANKTKVSAPVKSNKYVRQSGAGSKSVKLAVNRNTRIRIKQS